MPYDIPKIKYTGTIKQVVVGTQERSVVVGGEESYPFYLFEGSMPCRPRVAFEVWDYPPDDWQEWAIEPFRDVVGDPVAWARKCVDDYGAEIIALQLKSADPNGLDRPVGDVMAVVRAVAAAVDVPLIIWGTGTVEKDADLLKAVAEACEGRNVAIGPLDEKNYKTIGAACIAYGQTVIASSPIDVNLAKQLNILLGNLGVREQAILMDPTTGGLGYGLEYSYSVVERDRMAALVQEDTKLQFPVICNVAQEVWKTRETRLTKDEDPRMGDETRRSVLIESITAMTMLIAGADILILRHPESVRLVKEMISDLMA